MNRNHPILLDADEAETVIRQYGQGQLDLKVLEEVGKRLQARSGTVNVSDLMLVVFLMATAQMLIVVVLAIALLAGLLALVFGKANSVRVELGWLRHVVTWLVGFGVSFTILGMCPAEIASPTVQTWFVHGLIGIGFAVVTVGLLFLVRKQFQIPRAQFAALAASMTLPILAAIAILHLRAAVDLGVSAIARLHPVVTIASFLAFVWLCWKSIQLLVLFAETDSLSRRRKVFACGVLFLIALITIPAGAAMAETMSNEPTVKSWIPPAVWKEAEALQFTATEL
jgi:hypothetical protein